VPEPILQASSLYRFFRAGDEETSALRGVSLRVRPGELVAVIGPSGSGKSTLLACLAGLDEPDGGSVTVDGRRMSHRPETERAALRAETVGLLFPAGNLVGHLTVRQNVLLAQRLAGRHRPRPVPPVGPILDRLGVGAVADAYPAQLSAGEAARAGLAVGLANDPPVLLADEPAGELDELAGGRLLDLLRRRAGDGGAVVVASNGGAVRQVADRVVHLLDGQVTA